MEHQYKTKKTNNYTPPPRILGGGGVKLYPHEYDNAQFEIFSPRYIYIEKNNKDW